MMAMGRDFFTGCQVRFQVAFMIFVANIRMYSSLIKKKKSLILVQSIGLLRFFFGKSVQGFALFE